MLPGYPSPFSQGSALLEELLQELLGGLLRGLLEVVQNAGPQAEQADVQWQAGLAGWEQLAEGGLWRPWAWAGMPRRGVA